LGKRVSSETIDILEKLVSKYPPYKIEYLESELEDGAYENILDDVSMEERIIGQEYLRDVLLNAIRSLNDKEQKVIYMIFWEGKNQVEVARELGLNAWDVSRICDRALSKMRDIVYREQKIGE